MPRLAMILIAAALAGCATQQPPQRYVVNGCQPEMTAQECEAALVASGTQIKPETSWLDWLAEPYPGYYGLGADRSINRALGY